MSKLPLYQLTRRSIFALPLAALVPTLNAAEPEYRFHHDHVLGTSLDLILSSPTESAAGKAEGALLDEIDRLCGILSTYHPASEISRLNAAPDAAVSDELREVLDAYQHWNQRTSGAVSAELGGLVALWKKAEASQTMPSEDAIAAASRKTLNVDALGKAYVMRKAVEAAHRAAPEVAGLLLNVGGDILISGSRPGGAWHLGVADPANGRDNSPALTHLAFDTTIAVATSGIYERGHFHILDPRTGRPARGAAGATVIAGDIVAANALAAALCVLLPDEGLKLVEETPGAECLVVDRDGMQRRSSGLSAYERPRIVPVAAAGWPNGFAVSIELTLKAVEANGGGGGFGGRGGGFGGRGGGPGRVRRPYVAVWAEDANKKLVRNIAVWANKPRYLPELHTWFQRNNGGTGDLFSMTRATRPPGRYRLAWDGSDDKGRPVPEGTYRICVETNREHGNYATSSIALACTGKPASATLKESVEFDTVTVEYGPSHQTA